MTRPEDGLGEPQPLLRPSCLAMDNILGRKIPIHEHGFVRVIDYMGDDDAVVQAARVSYGKGTSTKSTDEGLLRYLMSHRHTTPFEMAEIKLHLKMPIFVARQWIRHRTASINEMSGRYSIMPSEFYVPAPEYLAPQSSRNKQGREGSYDANEAAYMQNILRMIMKDAFTAYGELADEDGLDLARELARIGLPLSTYTELYWKIDVHNLLHFLSLRADPHAQREIRDYADEIMKVVAQWMPTTHRAFEDYVMNGRRMSAMEMDVLRRLLPTAPDGMYYGRMSAREVDEFKAAMGWK